MNSPKINSLLSCAEHLKRQNRFQDAIKICEEILMENPQCVLAYEEIGDNYLSLRKLTKAEKALLYAKKLDHNSANAAYLLGFLYSCLEKWEKSYRELELANQLKPNHPEILRCLGWTLYQLGKKNDGIALLERSRNLAPKEIYTLTDLGMCYLNQKKFRKSQEIFEEVLKIDPNNSIIKHYLNDIIKLIKCQNPNKK